VPSAFIGGNSDARPRPAAGGRGTQKAFAAEELEVPWQLTVARPPQVRHPPRSTIHCGKWLLGPISPY
jgi:hypothetical protein